MSDEIKTTLNKLNKLEYDDIHLIICEVISRREIKILLDYITNLQEQLEVSQTNEETYRLEMKDITKILGLDEHTTFDEVKECATNLQKENQRLKNLCGKYEEEHNTAFKLWTMKMEEMPTYEEKIEMQKENQRLKEENNKLINEPTTMKMSRIDSVVANIYRNHKEQEDYKLRCENAIEKLKYYKAKPYNEYDVDDVIIDLDYILNGGDE